MLWQSRWKNALETGFGALRLLVFVAMIAAMVAPVWAQDRNKPAAAQQSDRNVPDAPSASKPAVDLPAPPVSPRNTTPPANSADNTEPDPSPAPPKPNAATPPARGMTPEPGSSREDLQYKIRTDVNFVQVPVTVKDEHGQLVEGLLQRDFTVKEDGNEQKIVFFTSDPFPLSAAVVVDLSMPDVAVQKVQRTLSALVGAFSEFDEVGVYTFGSTVKKWQDFTAATGERLSATMNRIKREHGRPGGAPVVGGPLGQPAPTINGRSVDPTVAPTGPIYRPEPHVLNDAILQAALDLGKRDPSRRRVLFVISEGREYGSSAGVGEVLKVLLSNQVSVYGVGVGGAALPGYGQLSKLDTPGSGSGNLLRRYALYTGGELYTELSEQAIEQAYARVTQEARNQYTLGYTTRATPSSSYRTIEVLVHRPNLKVYARDGYYPLPARR